MIRVLMIAPTPFFADRGCHVRIYEEVRALKERCDLRLVTYPLGDDPPGLVPERIRTGMKYEKTEAGPSLGRLYLDWLLLWKCIRAVREWKPDLVHAHLHEGAGIGWALKRLFGTPLLFDYQGSMVDESISHGFIARSGLSAGILRRFERWLDDAADRIVISTNELARGLSGIKSPVDEIADVVDPERFSPGEPPPGLVGRLGLPEEWPVVVYLGVTSDYQGVDIMVEAASIMRDEPAHFLVMGYPEKAYRAEAEARGLTNISFTGRLDYFRAHEYLRLGTVAMAPKLSPTESNGKLLLYAACGLPVIGFDLPVNRVILGEAGCWISPAGTRREMAEAAAVKIRELISDHSLRESMAAGARRKVIEEHSPVAMADRLMRIYEGLVKKSERKPGIGGNH